MRLSGRRREGEEKERDGRGEKKGDRGEWKEKDLLLKLVRDDGRDERSLPDAF